MTSGGSDGGAHSDGGATSKRGDGGGSVFIDGIGELLTLAPPELGLVRDAAVIIRGGRVVFAGARAEVRSDDVAGLPRIDAGGRLVTPGLVDPHTHLIFAGSRAQEFDLRAQGKTYLDIQAAGGGIVSTVRAVRNAGDEELLAGALARIARFVAQGVTTLECKTGYDLSIEGELRLLRLYAELARRTPVTLSPTLLAHVPPPDGSRADFVMRFCREAIPQAAAAGLADAVDVYCDAGAFTLDETRAILEAARAHGLALRAHAEQFTYTGAAELAASLGARSVEHLEALGPDAPRLLAEAGTVANLLPGAALTLKLPWPDARKLYAAGCTVALGTDCNPGSSLTESLPLMMSLGCMQMGLSCAEAWIAVTRAAAESVGKRDAGRLVPAARGDAVVWDAADHREVAQHFGVPLARDVVIAGNVVVAGNIVAGNVA
jgi:imidazolonepropionase